MDLISESRNVERENTATDIKGMQDQVEAARDAIEEKMEEISTLTASVNRLEN